MKKIKKINKLLSSLALLAPLAGVRSNNQYNTQQINDQKKLAEERKMGDITVSLSGTQITGYVSGEGTLTISSDITSIGGDAFNGQTTIQKLDLSYAKNLKIIYAGAFSGCTNLTGNLIFPSTFGNGCQLYQQSFSGVTFDNIFFISKTAPTFTATACSTYPIFEVPRNNIYIEKTAETTYTSAPGWSEGYNSKVITFTYDSEGSTISGKLNYNVKTTDVSNSQELEWTNWEPFDIDIDLATWSLSPYGQTEEIPSEVSINKGIISWNNLPEGNYTFKVVATMADLTSEAIVEINSYNYDTCKIVGPTQIQGLTLSCDPQLFSIDSQPSGLKAESWRYWMDDSSPNPAWLSIDNEGYLRWTNKSVADTYTFWVQAIVSSDEFVIDSAEKITLTLEPGSKSNTTLIISLSIGLGIPVILAIAFIISHIIKKKKTTVKIKK